VGTPRPRCAQAPEEGKATRGCLVEHACVLRSVAGGGCRSHLYIICMQNSIYQTPLGPFRNKSSLGPIHVSVLSHPTCSWSPFLATLHLSQKLFEAKRSFRNILLSEGLRQATTMADIVAIAALEAAAAKLAAAKRKEKEKEKEKTKLSPFLKDYELPSAALKKKPFDRERDEVSSSGEEGAPKRPRPRTEAELQARQLEKLMRKPEKPVELPARLDKKPPKIREFNLDVMGVSEGQARGNRRRAQLTAHAKHHMVMSCRLERGRGQRRLSRVPRGAPPRAGPAGVRARDGTGCTCGLATNSRCCTLGAHCAVPTMRGLVRVGHSGS